MRSSLLKKEKMGIIILSSKEVARKMKSDIEGSLTITTSQDLCSLSIPLLIKN
jgi:hypothetical protein